MTKLINDLKFIVNPKPEVTVNEAKTQVTLIYEAKATFSAKPYLDKYDEKAIQQDYNGDSALYLDNLLVDKEVFNSLYAKIDAEFSKAEIPEYQGFIIKDLYLSGDIDQAELEIQLVTYFDLPIKQISETLVKALQ